MTYLLVKHLHITCAVLSGSFFLLRGVWMLLESDALTMVFWTAQYPFVQLWLTAKVLALLAYIVLGTIALKRGQTKATRTAALVAALAVFAYIVLVALSRQVMPFLA